MFCESNMKSNQSLAFDKALTKAGITRWLYAGAAILVLILMFWGFQQFYLHGKAVGGHPLKPQIKFLIIAHGLAMTLWVFLLVFQSLLVATRRVRLHMRLGRIGAALAVCIFVLGFRLAIESARYAPEGTVFAPGGAANGTFTPKQKMVVPIVLILVFAAYVSIALLYRKRSEIHRPLMLFATINITGAATARILFFRSIYNDTFWGAIFGPASVPIAVGILFLIAHSLLTRAFDRHIAIILAVTAVIETSMMSLAPTETWDNIASFLLGIYQRIGHKGWLA